MNLIRLLLVLTYTLFAPWALAQEGSGQDYAIQLDEFVVLGPGAWESGWFDDFDDGDLGDWICQFGQCQDEPGTSFATLENPGVIQPFPGYPSISIERSDLASWSISESYVSPDDWFQGIAIFAAELPKVDESISLQLNSDFDDNGRMLHETTIVEIYNYSDEVSMEVHGLPGELRLAQYRYVYDENWNIIGFNSWERISLTAPEVLGNVILSIRFEDRPEGAVFHAGYSLTEIPELFEPFAPIQSNLHTTPVPGTWVIRAHVTFLETIPVIIDIKPGDEPNSINLCSEGVVPIAILGSDTFDVNDIDTDTLRFAEASVKVVGMKDPHSLCNYEDVNDDLFYDLVCQFMTADIAGIDGQSSTATVNGELLNGTPVEGTDSVKIVKDTCN